MTGDKRHAYRTENALSAVLGLVANYRLAGWTYEDAMTRAQELLPLAGEVLEEEWVENFWATVDADMVRGHGPLADALDRVRMWSESHEPPQTTP